MFMGIDQIAPSDFMSRTPESTAPPAQTVAQFRDQIPHRQIKVLVYNAQTSTSITDSLKQMATRSGIPVVGISETVQHTSASFQDWQTTQLNSLQTALSRQ